MATLLSSMRALTPLSNWLESESDLTPPPPPPKFGSEIKNVWSYTSVPSISSYSFRSDDTLTFTVGIARSKRDGTRAETRFGLSAKRTSPFISAGGSVQSTTGSRGVRISGQRLYRPCSYTVQDCWLPIPFASFSFTSPPVLHLVPSDSERAIPDKSKECQGMYDVIGTQPRFVDNLFDTSVVR